MIKNYDCKLDLFETEVAIKKVKDFFERALAYELNLTRVSAPLYVRKSSGLNDDLSGMERPVRFDTHWDGQEEYQIVHSLAKWKRMALKRYEFPIHTGLYTDMNAIRRDEDLDNIHSMYVDQWDWELVIDKKERTTETLQTIVKKIYEALRKTEEYVNREYPVFSKKLPENIFFITSQELEDRYPNLTAKQRENEICREYKAVFISQIGKTLNSGEKHDGRAPDYDDWELNGDILVWNPVLEQGFELSSMGVRVSEETLELQLKLANREERKELAFHKSLLAKELPYTVGGGIGQSRICMFFLEKLHIGEVQASCWPEEMVDSFAKIGAKFL